LEFDVADDAEGSRGGKDADEVQLDGEVPTVEMASSISSCTHAERRLERRWSSGAIAGADLLQVIVEERIREVRRRMRRGLGGEREHRAHRGR
jgi:hypothetical protein